VLQNQFAGNGVTLFLINVATKILFGTKFLVIHVIVKYDHQLSVRLEDMCPLRYFNGYKTIWVEAIKRLLSFWWISYTIIIYWVTEVMEGV
jgi:hypothetical protein